MSNEPNMVNKYELQETTVVPKKKSFGRKILNTMSCQYCRNGSDSESEDETDTWYMGDKWKVKGHHQPKTIHALSDIVVNAKKDKKLVHILGCGNLTDNNEDSNIVLVDLRKLKYYDNPEIKTTPDGIKIISANAGDTFANVNMQAYAKGYALETIPLQDHVSVGGGVIGYCFGNDDDSTLLSMRVREVVFMCRNTGNLRTVTNEAILSSIRGSLQEKYIIVGAFFNVIPKVDFKLTTRRTKLAADNDTLSLIFLTNKNKSTSAYINPYTQEVLAIDRLPLLDQKSSDVGYDKTIQLGNILNVYMDKNTATGGPKDKTSASMNALEESVKELGDKQVNLHVGVPATNVIVRGFICRKYAKMFVSNVCKILAEKQQTTLPVKMAFVGGVADDSVHDNLIRDSLSQDGYIALEINIRKGNRGQGIALALKHLCEGQEGAIIDPSTTPH